MACGETKEEVSKFLQKLKVILPFSPFFVVIDFAPALLAAVKEIFPFAVIGHDYFHTAKLLNEGLLKEMRRLKKIFFTKPINEYKYARKASIQVEKSQNIQNPKFTISYLSNAWIAFRLLNDLKKFHTLSEFLTNWTKLKMNFAFNQWSDSKLLINALEADLPACGLTEKNFMSYSDNICKIWRRLIRNKRQKIEETQKGLSKAHHHVLMNPKNMKSYHRKELKKDLKRFSFLRSIREIVCKFHYQFKTSEQNYRSLSFLKTLILPKTHPKLIAAVNTILNAEDRIFAYREVYKTHPKLKTGKSIRSNREEINRNINRLSRNQFGLRSTSSAQIKLAGILNCSFIVSNSLIEKEKKKL